MAGRYYSEELNATYELTKTAASLVLGRPRAAATTLQAVDQETFRGGGYTIRFAGPVAGKATSFTLEAGRNQGDCVQSGAAGLRLVAYSSAF